MIIFKELRVLSRREASMALLFQLHLHLIPEILAKLKLLEREKLKKWFKRRSMKKKQNCNISSEVSQFLQKS